MLDRGVTVTGRAVGRDGKPLAGLTVTATFTHRPATEAFAAFHPGDTLTADANGDFRVGGLFPGREFRLLYTRKGGATAWNWTHPGVHPRQAGRDAGGEMVLLIDHE